MKTVKPQKLGVLHRTIEMDRRPYLVVTLFLFVPLDAPRAVLTEVEMWKTLGSELGAGALLDEGWSKARGEVLVTGSCFPPGGAREASYVRCQLGAVDKRLAVIGDRVWKDGVPTPPVAFAEMPVDWAHAFGGDGYAPNPAGKGAVLVATSKENVQPLPNVEIVDALVRSPKERPPPAGFAPWSLGSAQRRAKAGTYDRAWLETQAPGIAKDTDPTFFNTAPDDQTIEGYFAGDEAFLIENMHPAKPRIEGRLPGLGTRAFIQQRTRDGESFREIVTRLDTVRFFPRVERGVLVFRGMIEIAEDDAADVLALVVACEDPSAPRPAQHYRDVLALRLDKRKGALAALRDGDLMPAPAAGVVPLAPQNDVGAMLASENLLRKNMRRRAEAEHAKRVAALEASGVRVADHVPPLPPAEDPPEDPEALAEYVERQLALAEEQRAAAQAKAAEQEKAARELCQKHGLDFEKLKAKGGGPPAFSARETLDRAPPGTAEANPGIADKLRALEAKLKETYARIAHHQPPAELPDAEVARWRGGSLVAALTNGEKLAARDFTGADLAGSDLRERDLSGVFLEGANLEGADLEGANLKDAVLARANLTHAKLSGAKVNGANLGGAKLHGVDLSRADLTGAVLAKADLTGARFSGATLARADVSDATFGGADFEGADASEFLAIRADLAGGKLRGAKLRKAAFVECDLTGADFTGAMLEQAAFVGCRGDGAIFQKANLGRAVFVQASGSDHAPSSFRRADFREASLVATTLRGTTLDDASFDSARLDGADLSECALKGAKLAGAAAPSALFIKADLSGAVLSRCNLMGAILQKAKLFGTDLTNANLFRADVSRVHVDGTTKLDGARLVQARVDPKRTDGSA